MLHDNKQECFLDLIVKVMEKDYGRFLWSTTQLFQFYLLVSKVYILAKSQSLLHTIYVYIYIYKYMYT